MERRIVSREQLQEIMNGMMAENEEYQDCHFGLVMPLQNPGDDGCNWSEPKVTGSGMPVEACVGRAEAIINDCRAMYNIEAE